MKAYGLNAAKQKREHIKIFSSFSALYSFYEDKHGTEALYKDCEVLFQVRDCSASLWTASVR